MIPECGRKYVKKGVGNESFPGFSCPAAICAAALFLYSIAVWTGLIVWTRVPRLVWRVPEIARSCSAVLLLILFCRDVFLTVRRRFAKPGREKTDADGASAKDGEGAVSEKETVLWAVCGAVFFILAFAGTRMVIIPLLVYYSRELSVKRQMETVLAAGLCTMFLWAAGLCTDHLFMTEKALTYGTFRGYGFLHPNSLALILFSLFLILWYLCGRAKDILFCGAGLLLFLAEGILLGCRTAAVLTALWFVLNAAGIASEKGKGEDLIRRIFGRPKIRAAAKALFTFLPVLLPVFAAVAGLAYMHVLDEGKAMYFSRRFTEIIRIGRDLGVSFFGRDLSALTERKVYLDNTFAWLLYRTGLLCAAGFTGMACLAGRGIFRSRDRMLSVIWLLLLLYSLMESIPGQPLFIVCLSCARAAFSDRPEDSLSVRDRVFPDPG